MKKKVLRIFCAAAFTALLCMATFAGCSLFQNDEAKIKKALEKVSGQTYTRCEYDYYAAGLGNSGSSRITDGEKIKIHEYESSGQSSTSSSDTWIYPAEGKYFKLEKPSDEAGAVEITQEEYSEELGRFTIHESLDFLDNYSSLIKEAYTYECSYVEEDNTVTATLYEKDKDRGIVMITHSWVITDGRLTESSYAMRSNIISWQRKYYYDAQTVTLPIAAEE